MKPGPGQHVAPAFGIAVLGLMHVPEQNEVDAIHRVGLDFAEVDDASRSWPCDLFEPVFKLRVVMLCVRLKPMTLVLHSPFR
jgi:hypothetical protein